MPAEVPVSLDQSAVALVRRVQTRSLEPEQLVRHALQRIAEQDPRINAFQLVLEQSALQEARELSRRADLSTLPLAGLPIAIKDNLAVAGAPTRYGSAATPEEPAQADHETVRRVRAAGGIIIGKTRLPELGLWGATDGAWGITRNPWDLQRSPGGSSGGGAAAVAAGMVPVAVANDGLGSIRIPAACCGLVGLKPGSGLVPAQVSGNDWFGFTENGVLATTVEDAALLLSVLADRPQLRDIQDLPKPVRIAVSTRSPAIGIPVDAQNARAALASAQDLRAAGHTVEPADPPYSTRIALAVLGHWVQATAIDSVQLDAARLESRTRTHARWGPLANRLGLADARWRGEWRRMTEPLFARFDVLLTPTLAGPPLPAAAWAKRSWLANLIANIRYAPFSAAWNLAGYPAMSVPCGRAEDGLPMGVQLVARPGGEALLLSLARVLEQKRPWTLTAPAAR